MNLIKFCPSQYILNDKNPLNNFCFQVFKLKEKFYLNFYGFICNKPKQGNEKQSKTRQENNALSFC